MFWTSSAPSHLQLSGLQSYYIIRGQVWRLITFIFIPLDNNPLLFILSLYMYWWIGSAVEREWGSTKFTVFYGTGVLMNILAGLILALFLGGFTTPLPTLPARSI